MAEKPKRDQNVEQVYDSKAPSFTVAWLNKVGDTPAVDVELGIKPVPMTLEDLDIFITEKTVDLMDNKSALNKLRAAFENNEISREDFIDRMDELDTANRSMGKGILFDGRKKKETRINQFAEWAMQQGIEEEVAKNYAAVQIAKYEASRKRKKGKGWGQIQVMRDIRE